MLNNFFLTFPLAFFWINVIQNGYLVIEHKGKSLWGCLYSGCYCHWSSGWDNPITFQAFLDKLDTFFWSWISGSLERSLFQAWILFNWVLGGEADCHQSISLDSLRLPSGFWKHPSIWFVTKKQLSDQNLLILHAWPRFNPFLFHISLLIWFKVYAISLTTVMYNMILNF